MSEASIRVTVGQRNAVLDWFQDQFGRPCTNETALDLAEAVLTAEDHKTRYCVLSRTPQGEITVYGPYATRAAAVKAVEGGYTAISFGSTARITFLATAPKRPAPKKGNKK